MDNFCSSERKTRTKCSQLSPIQMLQYYQQAAVEPLVDTTVQNKSDACLMLEHICSPSCDQISLTKTNK